MAPGTGNGLGSLLLGEVKVLGRLALELDFVSYSESFTWLLLEAVLD